MALFTWLVRFLEGNSEGSTEVRQFKKTKTGEFVEAGPVGLSAHEVSKPTGKGYEPPQGSIRRWRDHPAGYPSDKN